MPFHEAFTKGSATFSILGLSLILANYLISNLLLKQDTAIQ